MSQDKIKTLHQVVEEFYKDGEEEVANFKTRLATARDRLKELQKDPEMILPQGITQVEINDDLCFNYSVQRDLRPSHVVRICERFDPRVVRPASAVKRDGKYYLFDGQHTSVALAVMGFTAIPMTYVETTHQSFDAIAFEILNDTGILRAGTEEIHRGLLHRWHNDENSDNDRHNPKVKTAYIVDTLFKKCAIDLEPKRVRKSSGKCGPNQHYFSHFDYAYKGLEMTGDADVLEKILSGVKQYYGEEDGGEINQGIYIGLVKMYALAKEDGSTKFLPADWIDRILGALVATCGKNANGIHSAAKKQWQHTRGTSWDAPVAMSTLMREAYLLQAPQEDQFNPPHEPKVSMGVLKGDVCAEFVPYWRQPAHA
jgi:hypothetical protein